MSSLTKYGATIVLTLVVCAVVAGVFDAGYVIRPLDVPEELVKSGLGGQALASRIRDRTASISSRSGATDDYGLRLRPGSSEGRDIDLRIAGTDLPIRAVAAGLAVQLGLAPPQLAGSVWRVPSLHGATGDRQENRYRIVLRDEQDGHPILDFEGSIDALVERAAVSTLGAIDPTSAAAYLRTARPDERMLALAMAMEGVRRAKRSRTGDWRRLASLLHLTRSALDLPRALVVKASVLSTTGRYGDALAVLDEAEAAYKEAGERSASDLANDGRGYAAMQRAQRERSPVAFEADLQSAEHFLAGTAGRYDSSLFHLAEVKRLRFERALETVGCGAAAAFGEADDAFRDFERNHGTFTVAILEHALMLKRVAGFLHFEEVRSRTCVGERRFGDIPSLQAEADRLFEDAASLDPAIGMTWLEWGILTYERQIDTIGWHPGMSLATRGETVDTALARLRRGAELEPTYPYAMRRLADTVVARLSIDDGRVDERQHKDELRAVGLRAACEGLRLPSDDSRPTLEGLARTFAGAAAQPCDDGTPVSSVHP